VSVVGTEKEGVEETVLALTSLDRENKKREEGAKRDGQQYRGDAAFGKNRRARALVLKQKLEPENTHVSPTFAVCRFASSQLDECGSPTAPLLASLQHAGCDFVCNVIWHAMAALPFSLFPSMLTLFVLFSALKLRIPSVDEEDPCLPRTSKKGGHGLGEEDGERMMQGNGSYERMWKFGCM